MLTTATLIQAILCGLGSFYAVDALMPAMPAFVQGMVCAGVGYGSLIFTCSLGGFSDAAVHS